MHIRFSMSYVISYLIQNNRNISVTEYMSLWVAMISKSRYTYTF